MDGRRESRERRDWFDRLEAFTRLINRVFAAMACLLVLVMTLPPAFIQRRLEFGHR
jgi:cell division protein FtsX